jgi:serine/threonine-protein kinase HipA
LRNHGFLRGVDGRWQLSPIYDVVPHPRRRKTVLRLGRGHDVDIDDAFSAHGAFGLREEEASAIEAEVAPIAAQWREFMAARNISASDMEKIAPAFAEADRWEGSGGTVLVRRDEGPGSP